MYGLTEEDIQKLLQFQMPESQKNFQEVPQFTQGLLNGTQGQNQKLADLLSKGNEAAASLAKVAGQAGVNNNLAQRQAATEQQAQQELQKQAQSSALLGKIASMFIPGGSVLGYIKGKL